MRCNRRNSRRRVTRSRGSARREGAAHWPQNEYWGRFSDPEALHHITGGTPFCLAKWGNAATRPGTGTSVAGLYVVSQSTSYGSGITGVIVGGVASAGRILEGSQRRAAAVSRMEL